MIKTILSLFLVLFFLATVAHAQCDFSSAGVGTFDGTNYNNWTKMTDASSVTYGSYAQESTLIHGGANSLQVLVNQDHSWAMRMLQTCDYALSTGNFYTVTFWMYGGDGKTVKVALQQNDVIVKVIKYSSK